MTFLPPFVLPAASVLVLPVLIDVGAVESHPDQNTPEDSEWANLQVFRRRPALGQS